MDPRPEERRLALRVGPSSLAIEGRSDTDWWPVDASHRRFLGPTARPDLTLTVRHGPSDLPHGRLALRVGDIACIYQDDTSWIFWFGEQNSPGSADRMVRLDPSGKTGSLVMDVARFPRLKVTYPLEYPLEDLLFRHLLADRHAILVHACGVAWRGRGYLFVGSSGVGKSTTARLWKAAGASILNDDRVVMETSDDGIVIHPTPWSGDFPEVNGESVPLAALYLLRQGSEVAFESLRPASAAALILAKSFAPLWDPERMACSLEILDRVCRQVACGWLTVPPDRRAVTWVQTHP